MSILKESDFAKPNLLEQHEDELPLNFEDPQTIQKALGIENFKATPGRQYAYSRATEEVNKLQANMLKVAAKVGIEITEDDVADWQPDESEQKLLQSNLTNERKQLQVIDGVEAYNQGIEKLRKGATLREHQNQTMEAVGDFLESTPADANGSKIALIQLPTAAGKSGIIAKIAEAAKFDENPEDPVSVLVLVPTQQLVNQIVGDEEKGASGFQKFAPELEVGKYFQDDKDLKSVTVMCNSSFNLLADKNNLPKSDVVIVDEAHMLGPTTSENLEDYRQGKSTIGLTATPRKAIEMFGEPIVEMTLREGITDGILAPVRKAEVLETRINLNPDLLPEDPDARRAIIAEATFQARLKAATPGIIDAVERGLGVIVRCPPGDDIDYAKRAAEALRDKSYKKGSDSIERIRAIEVGGSEQRNLTGKNLQNLILQEANEGNIHVLAHVKQIGVGTDLPIAKLYVDLDPTANPDTITQNFGRVLRQFEVPDENKPGATKLMAAESIEFIDPKLGDKQWTVPRILRLKPGESLEYEGIEVPKPIKNENQIPELKVIADPEIVELALRGVTSRIVDIETVEGKEKPTKVFPDGLTVKEAANWFGVSSITLKGILNQLGGEEITNLSADDMELVTIYHSELDIAPLPPEHDDLLSVEEVMTLANVGDTKPAMFTRMLEFKGLLPKRFRTDDGVQKFFSRKELVEFLENNIQNTAK